jgi:hypothetical protein
VSAPGDAAELADLERRRLKALVDADTETAEAIHADDFQLVTPSGSTYTKTEYLASIKRGELQYLVWQPLDIDARVSGDAGCVRYRSRLNIVVGGFENGLGDYWHTDYYEKRGGRWRVVFSQATAIVRRGGRES